MEEDHFLKSVADDIRKALNAGGYRDIEFFDENLVVMNGPSGDNIRGEPTIARSFKPVSEHDIIVSLAPNGDGKYTILVTLDENVDFADFDEKVGTHLKRLGGTWGSRLEYSLQTLGREIKSKDDLKRQIHGNKDNEESKMNSHLSEKASMTGTTRSSYQKIGECKVIIRHSGKVNEEKFGARSRNIDAIFIETKSGERFRMAENNLHGARAMARHLSNGGSPFDAVGSKVSSMMNEMAQLRKMAVEARTMNKAQVLSEEQNALVEQIKACFVGLRETLKKMSGKVGYMRHLPMLESEESLVEFETDPNKQHAVKEFKNVEGSFEKLLVAMDEYSDIEQVKERVRKAFESLDSGERNDVTTFVSNYGESVLDNPNFARYRVIIATALGKSVQAPERTPHPATDHTAHTTRPSQSVGAPMYESGKTKVKTETKAAKNKEEKETVLADQVPVYDRSTDGRFSELTRDADNLFSVNEDIYGVAPEEVMLESWFDEAAKVEFFNEEELVIENAAPEIKKTLPENALGMLNMYVGHPLFNHYMRMYETQKILDDVLALVEEGSTLCENILTTREKIGEAYYGTDAMRMGRGEHPSDEGAEVANFDEALNKVNALISDRRLNLESAIDQVAKEIVGEEQDPDSYEQVIEHLWGLAEESGLVKHDFGSTFSDQVLAPNETISSHNDEIDAEEFYGDARFAENDESAEEVVDENMDSYMDPEIGNDYTCDQCGKPFFVDQAGVSHHFGDGGIDDIDYDADRHHAPYEAEDDYGDGQPDERQEWGDYMGGDDWDQGQYDDLEEMNRVRRNAGLAPVVREMEDKCSCGHAKEACDCPPDCECGCNAIHEGDPFARQSKRNLANPKSRMSLINPEDKIKPATLGEEEEEVDEAKYIDWTGNRERTMHDRLDRAGYGDRTRQDTPKKKGGDVEDQYAKMARERGIDPNKDERAKKPKYEEVEMPHHLPETEKPEGTPELSEDGARIIQLARYKQ